MPIIKVSSLLTCSFAKAEASVQHVMLVSWFRLFRSFASLSQFPDVDGEIVYLFLNSEFLMFTYSSIQKTLGLKVYLFLNSEFLMFTYSSIQKTLGFPKCVKFSLFCPHCRRARTQCQSQMSAVPSNVRQEKSVLHTLLSCTTWSLADYTESAYQSGSHACQRG